MVTERNSTGVPLPYTRSPKLPEQENMSYAEQLVVEKASEVIESRQEPDRYHLLRINGKLCSPFTLDPVEKYMDTTSPLGKKEFMAFDQAQIRDGEFLGFWLSPPHIMRTTDPNHLQAKLIVYETSELNGKSSLLNRLLLLDINYSDCLTIANEIAHIFGSVQKFQDSEDVRANTIFASHKMVQDEWLEKITKIINDQRQWSMIETGEDIEIAKRTVEWVRSGQINEHFGNNPLSCPPGMFGIASEVIGGRSIIMEGRLVRNCGKCGKTINRVIFKGYKCDCGGVYEGC